MKLLEMNVEICRENEVDRFQLENVELSHIKVMKILFTKMNKDAIIYIT